jgi:hypothetical protein
MSEQSPAPGDLLVSRRPSDDHFEVSIVPGRPQLAIRHQHEALKQAHAFAEKNGGAVWMLQGSAYIRMPPPKARRRDS